MCQEHCHFDVQVARRQGGAGLPSAVRLALAGSAHTVAGRCRPAGLSGCGPTELGRKVPGLLGRAEPQAGAGPGSDPGPALSSLQSTGPEGPLTTALWSLLLANVGFTVVSVDSNAIATYLAPLPRLSFPGSALCIVTQNLTVLKTCRAYCCPRAFALAVSSSWNTSSQSWRLLFFTTQLKGHPCP